MRHEIIAEIRRLAASLGKPPGIRTFVAETGITEKDWKGIYWARWGDALTEAGYQPNKIQERYDDDFLLRHYCDATRHFGSPATRYEWRMYSTDLDDAPSYTTLMNRYQTISQLRQEARKWALADGRYEDVISIFGQEGGVAEPIKRETIDYGWVYLLKSGGHFKIGRSDELEDRIKRIQVSLPEKVTLIHAIKTDDPSGIEAYWHRRFHDRRANGEWFKLSAEDVKAFKRRSFQ